MVPPVSEDRPARAAGQSTSQLLLWICGGALAVFLTTQAVKFGLLLLARWYFAALTAAFLMATPLPPTALDMGSIDVPCGGCETVEATGRGAGPSSCQRVCPDVRTR
jgi:hypothetical protein